MKTLNNYLNEALIGKNSKVQSHKYSPKTRKDLITIIQEKTENIKEDGVLYLADIDVSEITEMNHLFQHIDARYRNKIKIIDISGWETSQVTNMVGMFSFCHSVEQIKGIENLNTKKVERVNAMFSFCNSLKTLDLSKWDYTKFQNMIFMFHGCKNLEYIGNIGKWETFIRKWIYSTNDIDQQKHNLRNIFKECSKLKKPQWYKKLYKELYKK